MNAGLMLRLIGLGVVASVVLLAACDNSPTAPTNVGWCWRMNVGADGKANFKPVSGGVRNLESCAASLEAVAMREGKAELTGAYQGQYVFITPDMVQSSTRLEGARYRLFDAATRGKVDHTLKWMLEDEQHPSKYAPHQVGAAAR